MTEGPPSPGATEAATSTRSGRFAGLSKSLRTGLKWAVGLVALATGLTLLS